LDGGLLKWAVVGATVAADARVGVGVLNYIDAKINPGEI
jgi:hypothetical protein